MIEDIILDTTKRMDLAIGHCKVELSKVRTGRANPQILNSLKVEYYGSMVPLTQVSTITSPEPRLITIKPYEKPLIGEIEKSIMESNLGLTPNNNGESILIPIPPLSEERRKDLIKYVHQLVEESKVAIRNIRRDALHTLKDFADESHRSEDESRRQDSNIQDITNTNISSLESIEKIKEKELLEF